MKKPSLQLLLDREQEALDALLSKVRGGVRGPDQFDALEEEANGIAARIRAAFRGVHA